MWGPNAPYFGFWRGFWILDFGSWGYRILDFGDFGFWILDVGDFGCWILGILDFGFWGFWILDFRDFGDFGFWIFGTLCSSSLCAKFAFWNLGILDFGDFGFWILGILDFGFWGSWILDFGLGILDWQVVTKFWMLHKKRRLCTPNRVGGFGLFSFQVERCLEQTGITGIVKRKWLGWIWLIQMYWSGHGATTVTSTSANPSPSCATYSHNWMKKKCVWYDDSIIEWRLRFLAQGSHPHKTHINCEKEMIWLNGRN